MPILKEGWNKQVSLIEPNLFEPHSLEKVIETTQRMLTLLPDDMTFRPMAHYWADGVMVAQIQLAGVGLQMASDETVEAVQKQIGEGVDPGKIEQYLDIMSALWVYVQANEQVDKVAITADARLRMGAEDGFDEVLVVNTLTPSCASLTTVPYRRENDAIVEWADPITVTEQNTGGLFPELFAHANAQRMKWIQDEAETLEAMLFILSEYTGVAIVLPEREPWTTMNER